MVFGSAAADGSEYGAGLKNIVLRKGDNEYDPYVTLGLNLEDGLRGCTQISYKYKGAGHNLKAVTRGDEEGELSGYNYHKKAFEGSSVWTVASVSVPSGLEQEEDWGTALDGLNMADVVKLQWEVKKEATHKNLFIDDLKCEGMSIVPVVRPDEDDPDVDNSSSSRSRRSSSSRSSDDNDDEDDDDTDGIAGGVVAHSGLSATVRGNTLQVSVAKAGLVKIHVFDLMGHAIESHSESVAAGTFDYTFGSMGKGAYIVRVQQGSMAKTFRMQVR